jgi:hypothetical protein
MNMSAIKFSKRPSARTTILLMVEGMKKHGMTKMAEKKPRSHWDSLGQVFTAKFRKFVLMMMIELRFHLRFSELVGVRDE